MNIPCNKYFENKVVVITGAGGVLCGVLAEAYAAVGAHVALLDLTFANADRKAQELREKEAQINNKSAKVNTEQELS